MGTAIRPTPDYAAIVRAFAGYGERVDDPRAVGPALERGLDAIASSRVALIDVWLDPVDGAAAPARGGRRP